MIGTIIFFGLLCIGLAVGTVNYVRAGSYSGTADDRMAASVYAMLGFAVAAGSAFVLIVIAVFT